MTTKLEVTKAEAQANGRLLFSVRGSNAEGRAAAKVCSFLYAAILSNPESLAAADPRRQMAHRRRKVRRQ
jgi:hypothetical protein